jgi:polar amino acid transport system substrate-binding protein
MTPKDPARTPRNTHRFTLRKRNSLILTLVLATVVSGLASACGSSSSKQSSPLAQSSTGQESALFHLLPENIQKTKTIVLATNAEYPTYQYYATTGGPMLGFEVDIWNEIGKELGVHIDVINTAFDGLIPGVEAGRYQTSMEALGDSASREKSMIFVDTEYGTIGLYTLKTTAAAGTITSNPLSLCGQKTAVVVGSDDITDIEQYDSGYCTQHGKPAVQMSDYPDNASVLEALYSGRVSFIFSDAAAASQILKGAPVPTVEVPQNDWPKSYLGAIFAPDDMQLAKAWLAGLNAAISSGAYDAMMKSWDLTPMELNDPGINLASIRPLPST